MKDRLRSTPGMTEQGIAPEVVDQYRRLQRYVGWTDSDAQRVKAAGDIVRPAFAALIDDFYEAIRQEPITAQLITGGEQQIMRLKKTLIRWLDELFSGVYDEGYVARRWQVGRRHVEIGLRQVYADAAMARLRAGLQIALEDGWNADWQELPPVARSIDRLLDLEIALIEDAYTWERLSAQRSVVKEQSEATFRNLVEAARCIILILRHDHTLAYFSPFAEKVTGHAAGDVVGQDYLSLFFSQDDHAGIDQELERVWQGGPASMGYENTIHCRDGGQRTILWNAQRLDDYEGSPAVLAVGHDISDVKDAQNRLLQAERLAAIGETVTGLAHESRNAFQRSQACLEMLALELEGRTGELELVERIQRALDHLHQLYEAVRDYAAPITLDGHPAEVAHIWRDAWSHLEGKRAEKPVTLQETVSDGPLTCELDWFKLGQVFRNIFENALDACPTNGTIEVTAGRDPQNPEWIEVSVRDDGGGIPEETRARLFEPFYTTKTKGTGLGMAIAKRIVEAHGGTIAVGAPSVGAEFLIRLPALNDA